MSYRTSVLVIGDIVVIGPGFDMVIGFTPTDKIVLEHSGISDLERFDVIGNYDDTEDEVTLHEQEIQ